MSLWGIPPFPYYQAASSIFFVIAVPGRSIKTGLTLSQYYSTERKANISELLFISVIVALELLMKNGQESGDGEVQFTTVQRELIKEATTPVLPSKNVEGAAQVDARNADLRRAVYDTIVQLSEVVSESTLKSLLPFLHCGAWDEVVEERYLGNPRLCGFPLCGEVVEARLKKQRYHIDKVACKIYEHRIETDMYCSRSCLLRSASVRSQLPDEPLWLSCDVSKRICCSYSIEGPSELKGGGRKGEVEIVRAAEEKLCELKIREADSSTQSEAEDNDENETDVEEFLEKVNHILGTEQCVESKCESKSNTTSKKGPSKSETQPSTNKSPTTANSEAKAVSKPPTTAHNPRLPDPQMAAKHSFSKNELEKLSRLRSKYSTRGAKKPIIVDPVPVPKEQVMDAVNKTSEVVPKKSCEVPEFVNAVRILFRGWITDRTRQLLRSGGLCLSDSTSSVMKQFFRPFSDDVAEMNDVALPNVDSIDVKKKRLHIFLDSVKKPLTTYQRELEFSFSEFNWLYVIASTFNLEPTTITNFSNNVLKLVCAVLLKLISLLDTSVEDSVFPEGKVSDKLVNSLTDIGVDMNVFSGVISEILDIEEKSV
ncbi:hypothetical protein ANCCAN_24834 [Ancylostoma caninum]|uniref:RNA polymerase II subunit B1 CTD phosphatase RPAP2 homolog n=1 Tax=Ancylostoma caninum TaxID=29170 RepID=A0A368FEU8_ANCCA|nr:hypothetical protein ANCCAN_24834 [Ancylostoma caninum]